MSIDDFHVIRVHSRNNVIAKLWNNKFTFHKAMSS